MSKRTNAIIVVSTFWFSPSGSFVVREYGPIVPPFRCYLPITSIEDTDSMVECGIICSVSDTCIMYGYNSTNVNDINPPGTCAITSFHGEAVPTEMTFEWYAPVW